MKSTFNWFWLFVVLGVCPASFDSPTPRGRDGSKCCSSSLWLTCPSETSPPTKQVATDQGRGWTHSQLGSVPSKPRPSQGTWSSAKNCAANDPCSSRHTKGKSFFMLVCKKNETRKDSYIQGWSRFKTFVLEMGLNLVLLWYQVKMIINNLI